jgi:hypothetical protein
MAGTTVTEEHLTVEMDQTRRNYLAPLAGSPAAKTGAGIFLKA